MLSSRFLGGNIYTIHMTTMAIKDRETWNKEVKESDIPVFVDFWAEWCGPCRMVSPVIEELSNDYDGKVKFVKVNIDEAGDLASSYQVYSIPTLVLFLKGEGNRPADRICIQGILQGPA